MKQYPTVPYYVESIDEKKVLKILHDAGLFSCCTVKLLQIVRFFNENRKLPDFVDGSHQFGIFKTRQQDLTNVFFEIDDSDITYEDFIKGSLTDDELQFSDYTKLTLEELLPFVKKYFGFSNYVKDQIKIFENTYEINYENLCSVFYRGLDKVNETELADHKTFIDKCKQIQLDNPNINFLLQTDETEFFDLFVKEFPNSLYIKELPQLPKQNSHIAVNVVPDQRISFAIAFLAATHIVSKCKIMVTHTGNCGLWATLFRGNTENFYQFITGAKAEGVTYNFWNK